MSDAKLQAFTEEQIDLCLEWIRLHARERVTPNRHAFPYHLKHEVERWKGSVYIPESAFREAAVRAGFAIHRNCYRMKLRPRSPGAYSWYPTRWIPWEAAQ